MIKRSSVFKLLSQDRGGVFMISIFFFFFGVSGAIDLCLLIRLLSQEISNYYKPHDCDCMCVQFLDRQP